MIFTMPALSRSLADYLAPQLPGTTFLADPTQQGTKTPALFLRQTYAKIAPQPSGMVLRKLGLDLVYHVQFNISGIDTKLQAAADVMDLWLETFPYAAGAGSRSDCGPTTATGILSTATCTICSNCAYASPARRTRR